MGKIPNFTDSEQLKTPKTDCALKEKSISLDFRFVDLGFSATLSTFCLSASEQWLKILRIVQKVSNTRNVFDILLFISVSISQSYTHISLFYHECLGLLPHKENLSQLLAFLLCFRRNCIHTSTYLNIPTGTGCPYCSAETMDFLLWPNTSAGTTQSLHCPNTTTMINRTCSPSGVWESVDPSRCNLPQTQSSITLEEVLTDLLWTLMNVQEQTTGNLAMVAATFARFAQLIGEGIVISNTVSLLLFCLTEIIRVV